MVSRFERIPRKIARAAASGGIGGVAFERLDMCAAIMGVATFPGQTTETRMPKRRASDQSAWEKPTRPYLVVTYGRQNGAALSPLRDAIFTMCPEPCLSIWRYIANDASTAPRRLRSRERSQSSGVNVSAAPLARMPAQLMKTSILEYLPRQAPIISAVDRSSARSAAIAKAPISRASLSAAEPLRSAMIT